MKKYCFTMTVVLVLASAFLCACRHTDDPLSTGEKETQQIVTERLNPEQFPEPTIPPFSMPELPVETLPTQPDQDYFLPPGEQPTVEPQIR